jgi:hypothetical protein
MRIVGEYNQAEIKITIYSWNGKYLLKFERGTYEQTYKVSEMDVFGDDSITALINDETFMTEVRSRFQDMHKSLQEALDRN